MKLALSIGFAAGNLFGYYLQSASIQFPFLKVAAGKKTLIQSMPDLSVPLTTRASSSDRGVPELAGAEASVPCKSVTSIFGISSAIWRSCLRYLEKLSLDSESYG